MPYWRTPTTVRAAVDAVLSQTYPDLLLYLVNDGDTVSPPWPALADITDPRLIRVDLLDNRGRYFADAAVLAACRTPWFAIHDSDDVAAPDWLATLLDAAAGHGWVAAFAPQRVLDLDGRMWIEPVGGPLESTARLRHLAHHAAVYRTGTLREIGGPHPNFRIGYDTLMVSLVMMAGPVGAVDRALYTRQIRPDSLTTTPATGRGSIARRAVRRRLDTLHSEARLAGPGTAVRKSIPAEVAADVVHTATFIRTLTPEPTA